MVLRIQRMPRLVSQPGHSWAILQCLGFNVGDFLKAWFSPSSVPLLVFLSNSAAGYAACNSMTTPAPADCQWTQVAQANDPCLCRNVGDLFSAAMKAKFPLNYGAACNTWDYATCDTNYAPDQVDTWCCASWCYVDKACPSAKDSLNDGMQGILYWSDLQCEDDIKLMLQCPFQPDPVSVTAESNCTCLTDEMPESVLNFTGLGLNATTYNGYGTFCAPHDYQDPVLCFQSL